MIILIFLTIFTFNIFSADLEQSESKLFVSEDPIVIKSEKVVREIVSTPDDQVIPSRLIGAAINLQRRAERKLEESDMCELKLDIQRVSLDSNELGKIADMRNPAAYVIEHLALVINSPRFRANSSASRASSPSSSPKMLPAKSPRSLSDTPRKTFEFKSLHGNPQ